MEPTPVKDHQASLLAALEKLTDIADRATLYDTTGEHVEFPWAEIYKAMDDAKEFNLFNALQSRLVALKSDERLYYPTASVQINAPLALIQCTLAGQVNLLENLLGLPLSSFPLKH